MSVPIGHFAVSVRQWLSVTQVLSCASWDAWATLRCSWGRVLVLHRCCCKCSIVQEGKNKKKGEKKKNTHRSLLPRSCCKLCRVWVWAGRSWVLLIAGNAAAWLWVRVSSAGQREPGAGGACCCWGCFSGRFEMLGTAFLTHAALVQTPWPCFSGLSFFVLLFFFFPSYPAILSNNLNFLLSQWESEGSGMAGFAQHRGKGWEAERWAYGRASSSPTPLQNEEWLWHSNNLHELLLNKPAWMHCGRLWQRGARCADVPLEQQTGEIAGEVVHVWGWRWRELAPAWGKGNRTMCISPLPRHLIPCFWCCFLPAEVMSCSIGTGLSVQTSHQGVDGGNVFIIPVCGEPVCISSTPLLLNN